MLNDENRTRFLDHIDFVRNFEARAGTEGAGYRLLRSQFFANNDGLDRDLSDLFRVAFPPIHNTLDMRRSTLIETNDPRAADALQTLNTHGYWVLPVRIPDAILANIVPTFERAAYRDPGRASR